MQKNQRCQMLATGYLQDFQPTPIDMNKTHRAIVRECAISRQKGTLRSPAPAQPQRNARYNSGQGFWLQYRLGIKRPFGAT